MGARAGDGREGPDGDETDGTPHGDGKGMVPLLRLLVALVVEVVCPVGTEQGHVRSNLLVLRSRFVGRWQRPTNLERKNSRFERVASVSSWLLRHAGFFF